MFKWAREHDCPWDSFTCHAAARRGHLEVLQWARAHNCPWDVWTCAWTAAGGQLEAWAYTCPLLSSTSVVSVREPFRFQFVTSYNPWILLHTPETTQNLTKSAYVEPKSGRG